MPRKLVSQREWFEQLWEVVAIAQDRSDKPYRKSRVAMAAAELLNMSHRLYPQTGRRTRKEAIHDAATA